MGYFFQIHFSGPLHLKLRLRKKKKYRKYKYRGLLLAGNSDRKDLEADERGGGGEKMQKMRR